jgi:hypothetical protein
MGFSVASFTLKHIGEARMSKIINPAKIVAIAFVAMALSANSAVLGQPPQNPPEGFVDYLYGLVDFDWPNDPVKGYCTPVGSMWGGHYIPSLYPNLNNFPTSHITHAGNGIYHIVGNHIAAVYGLSFAVPPIINTAAAANTAYRLWDRVYGSFGWGYTKVNITDSIDPSMNCHGYSTGLNTWIMDMETLLADDYEHTFLRDHLVPGAIFFNPNWIIVLDTPPHLHFEVGSHSSRIDAVHQLAGTHDLTVKVVEKNRVSALYEKTFTMQALCPNNCHLHSGPCNMANAPLPWSPNGFYRKLP